MALTSLDGQWIEVNRALCDLSGYSEKDLLATTCLELTHPDDRDHRLRLIRRLLDGKSRSVQCEKRLIHKKGFPIWVLCAVSLCVQEDGRPEFFIEQIQDITGRKALESTLNKHEEQLERLFENLPDVICRYDARLNLTYANSAIEAISGLPARSLIGKPPDAWGLSGSDEALWNSKLQAVLATGHPDSAEFKCKTPIGHRHFYSRFIPERNASGRAETVLVITQDISQRVFAEDQLRIANAKLHAALTEVKQLQGIIPMCAYCKKIRDDKDYWEQLESYLGRHSEAEFTHSICPECFERAVKELGSQLQS